MWTRPGSRGEGPVWTRPGSGGEGPVWTRPGSRAEGPVWTRPGSGGARVDPSSREGRGPCGHVQGREGHPSGLPTYASLAGTCSSHFLPGARDRTETGSQSSVSLASECCFCSRAAQLRAAGEVRISKRRKEGISTKMRGTSVVVQWFKASASSAGDAGSIPGQRANMLHAGRAKTLAPKTEAIW